MTNTKAFLDSTHPRGPEADYPGILKDEVEARLWLSATGLVLTAYEVIHHVGQVDAALATLPDDMKAQWAVTQHLEMTMGNSGFRLKQLSIDKIEKRLAAGRATEFGKELEKRKIDRCVRLRWWLHVHAREMATEDELKLLRMGVPDTPANRKKLGMPLKD